MKAMEYPTKTIRNTKSIQNQYKTRRLQTFWAYAVFSTLPPRIVYSQRSTTWSHSKVVRVRFPDDSGPITVDVLVLEVRVGRNIDSN